MYVVKHILTYPHSWIHVTSFGVPQQPKWYNRQN